MPSVSSVAGRQGRWKTSYLVGIPGLLGIPSCVSFQSLQHELKRCFITLARQLVMEVLLDWHRQPPAVRQLLVFSPCPDRWIFALPIVGTDCRTLLFGTYLNMTIGVFTQSLLCRNRGMVSSRHARI